MRLNRGHFHSFEYEMLLKTIESMPVGSEVELKLRDFKPEIYRWLVDKDYSFYAWAAKESPTMFNTYIELFEVEKLLMFKLTWGGV